MLKININKRNHLSNRNRKKIEIETENNKDNHEQKRN